MEILLFNDNLCMYIIFYVTENKTTLNDIGAG